MNLSALSKATTTTAPRTGGISVFSELELTLIMANPNQPRKHFDAKTLQELADSIRTNGLIQPIAVVKKHGGYMIVSGERRFQASKILGLRTIKAHILTADEHTIQELALIENIQREDLSDFEKAKFIGQLWASGHYAQKQDLAAAIGKSSSYLSKAFGCLKLDVQIIADIEENKHDIGLSVLEEIGRIKDTKTQREVYDKYVSGEITRDDFSSFKTEAKISHGKIKQKREISFGAEGCNFDVLKDDLSIGIIFHPIDNIFTLDGLKSYKMYRITIEEV